MGTLYSWYVAAVVAGWTLGGTPGGTPGGTSRWFGVAGAALADSKAALPQLSPGTLLDAAVVWRGRGGTRGLYCTLPRLSLGGRRGGLAWQARRLGTL